MILTAVGTAPAKASAFTVIHSFCSESFCTDGRQPTGSLLRDAQGTLYGATEIGGKDDPHCNSGCGVVYAAKPGSKKPYRVVYNFCSKTNCKDGFFPEGGLIMDVAGRLYGVTNAGGKHRFGVIFRLAGKKLEVLHDICAKANCTDGISFISSSHALTYQGAASGAPYDGVSPLYGTMVGGGTHNAGVLFKLTPPSAVPGKKSWTYEVLYNFCSLSACADGEVPHEVFADASGVLYGTTFTSDTSGGLVFKFADGTFQKLYSFCAQANCADGKNPFGSTVMDAQGRLVGVTANGGSHASGTLFRLVPGGGYSKLYDFCSEADCADGWAPTVDPVLEADGSLLGVTRAGGAGGNTGALYRFKKGVLKVLYDFCVSGQGCSDGANPGSPLAPDGAGNYFGTTTAWGEHDWGTLYQFTP